MRKRIVLITGLAVFVFVAFAAAAFAQDAQAPALSINVGGNAVQQGGNVAAAIKIAMLMTVLAFAPAAVMTMTSFTRIAIVLGVTRTTLGTASTPPNMVITGLALFLTIAIMNPIFTRMYQEGINPYLEGQISEEEALTKTVTPLKQFLVKHAREKDLALFLEITHSKAPESPEDVPFFVAVPSFVMSELNLAFQIGFMIAVPFLILDMVVSSVLTSMSMITLPPVVISLPLKLMLFVIVDGWHLIVSSLVQTYHV